MTTENASPEPVKTATEEFDAAFAEAVAEGTPAATPATKAAEPAAEPTAAPAAEATDNSAATTTEATPTDPVEPAAATPPAESPETRIAQLEAENAKLKEQRAPVAPAVEQPVRQQAPATPEDAAATQPKWYELSDGEQTAIKDFRKDWPDIAAAQDVMLKQAGYNVAQYVFDQLAKVYNPVIQDLAEKAAMFEEQLTLSTLRGAHSDYDQIYDKVSEWVDTLPGAFRMGAKSVMENGTPEEVNELIATYKQQTGVQAPAAAVPRVTPPAPVTPKTELSAAAKKAASKLSVVESKRSTPIAGADPNDFDGAWKEAIGG